MAGKESSFTPWRSDFIYSAVMALMGAFALFRGLTSGRFDAAVAGIFLAAFLGAGAKWAWSNGRRRWYGKSLEVWAVEKLGGLLDRKRVPWESGRMIPGLGDVDMLVETKRGLVVVEIKSFEKWHGEWSITGYSLGDREASAVAQAARQRDALSARHGIVWLPRGRPTLMQRMFGARRSGVRVVFGDARSAWRCIR